MFASCVLLGRDPTSFAPYRPALGKAWAERVGETAGTTPGERYATLLSLCDGLRERWSDEEPRLRDRLDAQGLGWAVLKWAPPDTWPPMKRAELQHWREGRTDEVRVERGAGICPDDGGCRVGGAGRRAAWRDLRPRRAGSGAGPSRTRRTWPPGSRPARAGQGFAERLTQQLQGASDGVLCLAAELLYLRDAPLHDMKAIDQGGPDRRHPGRDVGRPDACPTLRGRGWTTGTPSPAVRATTPARPSTCSGCAGSCCTGSSSPPEVVDEALRDPFAFREVTTGVPGRLAVDPLRRGVPRLARHLPVRRERRPPPARSATA